MFLHLAVVCLLLSITTVTIRGNNDDSRQGPASKQDADSGFDNVPIDALRNVDIQNIDVNRMRSVVEGMLLREEKAPDARRAAYFTFYDGLNPYYQAKTARLRRRVADNMAQLLFMARYTMRAMQASEHYSTNSTNFRMAYAYRTSQRACRLMHIVYRLALDKAPIWHNITYMIILHSKIVRLHLDYLYMYWVGVRIDNAVKEYNKAKQRVFAEKQKKMQKKIGDAKKGAGIQGIQGLPFGLG